MKYVVKNLSLDTARMEDPKRDVINSQGDNNDWPENSPLSTKP